MAVVTVYATKDATARENDDSWNGFDVHLPVGQSAAGNRYRSFIYFPISFSGITNISEAKLILRASRDTGGTAGFDYHVTGDASGNTRQLEIRRVTADWGEGVDHGEAVWADQTWGWVNRASEISVTNISLTTFTGYTHGDFYECDVTGIVQNWQDGSPNYGFALMIYNNDTVPSKALEFFSRSNGSGFRPALEITHSANIAPNAPVSLTPTSNALVNTLTPTLTGTRSDPDSGDYITAYQIRMYEDNGTTLKWDSGTLTQTGTSSVFSKVYSGPSLTGNKFYKWQARTRDKGALWGAFSALQRFETNTPPNPPSVVIVQNPDNDLLTLTPTLNVTHSDNDVGDSKMYGYRVILSTAADVVVWDSGDVDTSGAPLTTKSIAYSGPSLSWASNYKVKARTKDGNNVWGSYSASLPFSTHKTAVPIGLEPSGETVTSLTPTIEGARGSTGDTITSYQIILYANDGVTQLWSSGTLTTDIVSGASFSKVYNGTALSLATTYKWKVRATGSIGGTSDYSALQSFTTPADVNVPSLSITPVTSGKVTSLTPTFGGSRAATFTNYQIEVYPSTATSGILGTPIWDSGNLSQAAATSFSKLYTGPALAWGTSYKWRARVGSPTLGSYTGLTSFSTDSASIPTLTSPADNAWIVPATTNFTGSAGGGDSIIARQVQILASNGSTVVYDSTMESQGASGTFTESIDLTTLASGTSYLWRARYTKSGGQIGPWSLTRDLRLNGAPLIPKSLFPTPGHTFDQTLLPNFEAEFDDPDETSRSDEPTSWEIEVRNNATDALIDSITISSGLLNGLNEYQWTVSDTTLAYNIIYKWRTRFTDTKSAVGAWSSYSTFSLGEPPVISNISPSNGSNIATTRPVISWDYSDPGSLPMHKYSIEVIRDINNTIVFSTYNRVSAAPSFQLPTGHLRVNGEDYTIKVTAFNSAGLRSNTLVSNIQLLLDAPPPIEGLSATVVEEESRIVLDWDPSSLGTNFVAYVIYRRDVGDSEWGMIGTRRPETATSFSDWYAGQRRNYEYRVTVVKLIADEPDVESPDSDILTTALQSDVWMVVGKDRAQEHIFELLVHGESHSRPVQQETFEPLGSNRKAVVRGFVLGHEGSVDVSYQPDESRIGKEQIEYLLYYAGPHILKNPFGDVFDVTFGSPDYQYNGGGSLDATLTWTEVGATNNPLLTPDDYLAQIGAE